MVRAILEGRKTQTRRVVTPQNCTIDGWPSRTMWDRLSFDKAEVRARSSLAVVMFGYRKAPPDLHISAPCVEDETWHRVRSKLEAGDRLWVKETFSLPFPDKKRVAFRADVNPIHHHRGKWKPSIFMPRWASRLTLEIVTIRAERLQQISEADAKAEGSERALKSKRVNGWTPHVFGFSLLWDSINLKRGFGWDKNPWVWVIEFRKIP
jgi:hypothetical protein